jgi:predicted nucleic acid-binding Zn ribbon protein
MARKTVGFVQLEWTCPRCQTRNPGPHKFCTACGGPQPSDVAFEQPAQEKLLTDAAEIARAKAGPDVHCPYCQNRNPAGAKFCGSCGGDLTSAEARRKGQVLGAHRAGPVAEVACPSCGSMNPGTALACMQCGAALARPESPKPAAVPAAGKRKATWIVWVGLGLAALCLFALVGALVRGARSTTRPAIVQSVRWERTIDIEGLVQVEAQAWQDEIPSGAQVSSCATELRSTSAEYVPGAQEVCGTPYTVDSGSGYGEVIQDCTYEVYDEYCTYAALDWQVIDTARLNGSNPYPDWPSLSLTADERAGASHESYTVVFSADGETITYAPGDAQSFQRFAPGSAWTLTVNGFGAITDLQPAD